MKIRRCLFLCLLAEMLVITAAYSLANIEKEKMSLAVGTAGAIEIAHNGKDIAINVVGETLVVNTMSPLVKDVLQEAQITVGPNDRVVPGLDEEAADTIKVIRVEKINVTEEKDIPFEIERKNDGNLLKGQQQIMQQGKKGLEKNSYEVILEDGKMVAKNLLERVLVKKPVSQIVLAGTSQTVSRGNQTINFEKSLTVSATAYTHTGQNTYTGIAPKVGIIAVDPKVIPLGTRMYIDGYGYATAMDIGGSIKGNRIDVFLDTKEECMKWGRRKVQVFILARE